MLEAQLGDASYNMLLWRHTDLWHELFLSTYVIIFSFEFSFLLFLDFLCRFWALRITQRLHTLGQHTYTGLRDETVAVAPWGEHPPSLHRSKDDHKSPKWHVAAVEAPEFTHHYLIYVSHDPGCCRKGV